MEPILAADRNLIGSYRKLAEHQPGGSGDVRAFGPVSAFRTGIPISLFNGALVTAPSLERDVDAALDWLEAGRAPYLLWVHEDLVDPLLEWAARRQLAPRPWLMPQMVLAPVPQPPAPPPGVAVDLVEDDQALATFRQVLAQDGTPRDVAERLIARSFAYDADVRLFVGRLDGRPVATSVAIRTGDVSGVYAVGTLETARRRGVGTAVTWAAIGAGRDWGCSRVVLQSSEMGFPVYRAIGFQTVVRYVLFRPAP